MIEKVNMWIDELGIGEMVLKQESVGSAVSTLHTDLLSNFQKWEKVRIKTLNIMAMANLRIAHLRIAHWGAILRWAILSPSVIGNNITSSPCTLTSLINLQKVRSWYCCWWIQYRLAVNISTDSEDDTTENVFLYSLHNLFDFLVLWSDVVQYKTVMWCGPI